MYSNCILKLHSCTYMPTDSFTIGGLSPLRFFFDLLVPEHVLNLHKYLSSNTLHKSMEYYSICVLICQFGLSLVATFKILPQQTKFYFL